MVTMHGGADVPTKVQRPYSDDHALSGWIEALGVDQTYQPPPEPMLKPGTYLYNAYQIKY
jgi:hypothetical protein